MWGQLIQIANYLLIQFSSLLWLPLHITVILPEEQLHFRQVQKLYEASISIYEMRCLVWNMSFWQRISGDQLQQPLSNKVWNEYLKLYLEAEIYYPKMSHNYEQIQINQSGKELLNTK